MNALDKLDAVQIEADNRISETDRRFCEAHQAAYVDAKASLNELEYMWMDIISRQTEALKPAAAIWNNVQEYTYLHRFSEQDIREKLEELNDLFISNLVRYFNDRYILKLKRHLYVIEWKNGCLYASQKNFLKGDVSARYLLIEGLVKDGAEVIGNIYENSELLEG